MRSFVALLAVLAAVIAAVHADTWDESSCRFTISSTNEVIDVSSLAKSTYYAISDVAKSYNYLYNFCNNLGTSVGSCQAGDIACQQSISSPTTAYRIAYQYLAGSAAYNSGAATVKLTGDVISPTVTRTTTLIFNCASSTTGEPILNAAETGTGQYTITIQHNCCCKGACSAASGGGGSSGLSGGSILLIIFFPTVFVYLVGGMVFKRVRSGASGVEMVPNIDFWREVPGLIKDGFKFTFSCGGGGYSRI